MNDFYLSYYTPVVFFLNKSLIYKKRKKNIEKRGIKNGVPGNAWLHTYVQTASRYAVYSGDNTVAVLIRNNYLSFGLIYNQLS